MGPNQFNVEILGQDGGKSIVHDGVSYWVFGDTMVDLNKDGVWDPVGDPPPNDSLRPNSVATSSGFDPTTCLKLTSKQSADKAVELLPVIPAWELGVWNTGWVQPDATDDSIYFYYASTASGGPVQGVGLAEMTGLPVADDLVGTRKPRVGSCATAENCLFWKNNVAGSCTFDIDIAHPMRVGSIVYVYFETDSGADVRLARVAFSAVEFSIAYSYWNGSGWVSNPCDMEPLWSTGQFLTNGMEVTYNDYLDQYLAVYTFTVSDVVARVAPAPTGPWSDVSVKLVDCESFLESVPFVQPPGFLCYGGIQYPHLERNGGQIIYVAYSNTKSYRVYVQQVVFGTPVFQWADKSEHVSYRREGVSGPAGFTREGVAFYAFYDASDCSDPALLDVYTRYSIVPVYGWTRLPAAVEYIYTTSTSPIGGGYTNQGVAFCASDTDAGGQLAPIRRWELSGEELHLYTVLDLEALDLLTVAGGEPPFYVRAGNYGVGAGVYDVSHQISGGLRHCRISVFNEVLALPIEFDVRGYCYTDHTSHEINPEAYPGIRGDGTPGAPPPGPEVNCITPTPSGPRSCGLDPGSGNLAYGDVDEAHAQLSGTLAGLHMEVTGCFDDPDDQDALDGIYVEWEWDGDLGLGTSKTWIHQNGDCASSPVGTPQIGTLQAIRLAAEDSDGDGVPDSRELGDDDACGRRDPFNPYDYYDVSIPRDSVIDLPNDILGVILHFNPGGYDPGDENWDRPAKMTGAGGTWNRGSPDGVIDLPNDILGVILQFNPGGCEL